MELIKNKSAIVICSRKDSSRIPRKPFQLICGKPIIEYLLEKCIATGIKTILAVPSEDIQEYSWLDKKFNSNIFSIFTGSICPLNRMNQALSIIPEVENVIRITHDKIFIEDELIFTLLKAHVDNKSDYTYSNEFTEGSGLEIISSSSLSKASNIFSNKVVEHISYAVKAITKNIKMVHIPNEFKSNHRLLIDYNQDLKMMELLVHSLKDNINLKSAIRFLDEHQWMSRMNRLPKITIYTCAYNAEKWITKAMGTVSKQNIFRDAEYILIDDYSKDSTPILMSKFCSVYKNAYWVRNKENIGLSSSSNLALSMAKGKYIIRLDADDYFIGDNVLESLIFEMENLNVDAIYPDNYFGSFEKIQKGNENHHVGGTLFRTRAANHIKFTDKLRGYEGLDFFIRAKDQLNIGYIQKPCFFYRQTNDSMSKTNIKEREILKKQILRQSV